MSLVRHPRFAGLVDDDVVEFGNARYQDIADRHVAGDPVPRDQLRQIWENTTIVTGVWTAPMYEGFLAEIRTLNASLPPDKQIRIVLGDPRIDWSVVRGPADEDMNDWRDAHFAWAVEEHVMKRGRRALLWIGGAHISRQVLFPNSLIHLLDRRFPSQTLVALAIDWPDVDQQVSSRLQLWPSLMAAPVRDTWLGRLDGHAVGFRLSTDTVERNIDVAIFWEFPPRHAADAREANGVQLSLETRARLVMDWLVAHGIRRERLVPRGCGSSRALWVGDTEQERAANRKAELVRMSKWAGCEPPPVIQFPVTIPLLVDLADGAPGGVEGALHPAGPDRRVLAREMDPSFGSAECVDESDLAGRVKRKGSALPGVEAPAVRDAAFKRLRELREYLLRLQERRAHPAFLTHALERRGVLPNRIRRERAAAAWVRPRIRREALDGQIGRDMPAEAVPEPETRAGLEEHFCGARIVLFTDRLLLGAREPG